MISVRIAEPEDIQQVSDLWLKMVNEIYPENTPRQDWWIEICKALMTTERYFIVIAEVDGRIVGFIDGFAFPEPSTGKIHGVGQHMYVSPEYRSTSAARKLYKKGIQIARRLFNVQVREFYCTPENRPFWEKKGYVSHRLMMRRTV